MWRSWAESELYRIRTCSLHFSVPNIHRSCHSQPVSDRPAVLMIAREKLDGSPQVTSRQQPINVAFSVSDRATFASTNTRFHNIQLSFQSHLRVQLMTQGSSHQIDPLGQMSVEARCMLISRFLAHFCNLTSEKQIRGVFRRNLKWQRRTKQRGFLSRAFWREFYWSDNDEAEVPEGSLSGDLSSLPSLKGCWSVYQAWTF